MSDAAVYQGEFFPVVETKVKKRSPLWQYLKATAEHGPLATPAMVAASIGVSRQRVYQLISEGRLESVHVVGKTWIGTRDLEQFLLIARRSGQHSEFQAAESYGAFLERLKVA